MHRRALRHAQGKRLSPLMVSLSNHVNSAVVRKNSKTMKFAKLASMKSTTCKCSSWRKSIFSHVLRLRGEIVLVPPPLQQIDSHTQGLPETSKCLGVGSFRGFENSQKVRLSRKQMGDPVAERQRRSAVILTCMLERDLSISPRFQTPSTSLIMCPAPENTNG